MLGIKIWFLERMCALYPNDEDLGRVIRKMVKNGEFSNSKEK